MKRYSDRYRNRYPHKLDVSNWWQEYQNEQENGSSTILASDRLSEDVLQLLFDQLTIQESLPLGLTCRRLYYHLKKAQKTTKTLKLINTRSDYYDNDDSDSKYSRLASGIVIPSFGAVASKLIATYSGLRSLSLASSCSPDNIATLFTDLPTKLPLLASLSLAVKEYDSKSSVSFPLLEHFWRPLASLESHPSLRQLAITLLRSDYQSWVKQSEQPPPLPPLPILRQLTSFTFGSEVLRLGEYANVVRALGGDGAHLTPGVDARLEVMLFRGYYFSSPDYDQVSTIEPVLLLLLPYITLLDVAIGWQFGSLAPLNYQLAMATLFRYLPRMRQLRQLKLTIFSKINFTEYHALLAALSTLTALRTLTVEVDDFEKFSRSFDLRRKIRLTVLPRVRFLSISLRFDWDSRNVHRWDLVERLQLVTCFPELHSFDCTFSVPSKCKKHFNSEHPQYAHCGLELARGVVELLPERIVKKVEVKLHGVYHFSSLEMMAECRKKELPAKRREEKLAAKRKKNAMRKRHSFRKVVNLRNGRCTFYVKK